MLDPATPKRRTGRLLREPARIAMQQLRAAVALPREFASCTSLIALMPSCEHRAESDALTSHALEHQSSA
jgi:hypothetical protein